MQRAPICLQASTPFQAPNTSNEHLDSHYFTLKPFRQCLLSLRALIYIALLFPWFLLVNVLSLFSLSTILLSLYGCVEQYGGVQGEKQIYRYTTKVYVIPRRATRHSIIFSTTYTMPRTPLRGIRTLLTGYHSWPIPCRPEKGRYSARNEFTVYNDSNHHCNIPVLHHWH